VLRGLKFEWGFGGGELFDELRRRMVFARSGW
jgi:hypothetical protein